MSWSRLARAMLVVGMAASATACATVTRGTTQAWSVETVPGGATVRTTDGYACDATPCTFKMPRKSEFGVTITKPGYKKFETRVVHDVAGAGAVGFAGNVLIGGIVGMGVDAATGAALDLKPNPLKVTLEPELAEAAQAAAPAPAVPVAVATPAAKTP